MVAQKNRHILEVTRALLFERNVLKRFWREVLHTSAYLINCVLNRVLKGNTPISLLFQTLEVFSLSLYVFGYVHFIHDLRPQVQKLDARAMKRVFFGYPST